MGISTLVRDLFKKNKPVTPRKEKKPKTRRVKKNLPIRKRPNF